MNLLNVAERSGRKVTAMVGAGGWIERSLPSTGDRVVVPAPSRTRSSLFWRGLRLLQFSWTLLRHRDLLRKSEVIIVNDPELFLPSAFLASFLESAVTLYLHMAYRGLAASVLRFAAGFSSVTRIVCVSRFAKRHTEAFLSASARDKLVVIENALSSDFVRADRPAPPGDMSRIAVIGRLVPVKGQDVVCALSRALPQAEFYVIGSLENADERYVELLRQNSASNVKLVGYVEPVITYLHEETIGIVLVPSRIEEALPLVAIEAAAAGCAVIVRNRGGLAEVAANTGLMTVDRDDQFLDRIRELQAMDPAELRSYLSFVCGRAAAHYHPARFERAVSEVFEW